jgi:hypothetical protein
VLNLASNNLGEIALAAGWRSKDDDDMRPWVGPEGQEQDEKPGKPEGIIAIVNAIPDMGALTHLDISSNNLVPAPWNASKRAFVKDLTGNGVHADRPSLLLCDHSFLVLCVSQVLPLLRMPSPTWGR